LTKANQGFLFDLFRSGNKTAPGETKESRSVPPRIAFIDLELIRANPAEPRKTSNETGLRELADSIQKYGLLSPILVRAEADGTFTTLAGSQRLKACRLLRHKTIPALVIDGDPL
jgi:ParB family chromosome partitioning protein